MQHCQISVSLRFDSGQVKNDFRKIRMDDVIEIIRKKGYYFIPAGRLYDNFTGPNRIVVTDDPDFALSHPELAHMVILSIAEFKPMAEAYNDYLRNEIREIHRHRNYHNGEGYYENGADEECTFLKIRNTDRNPVEDNVLKMLTEENLRNAMKQLGENQYRRIYAYYFKGMTYRQIAAAEGVSEIR